MARDFADKSAARQWVWDRLSAEGVARFPFPPHGRIPNFAGAEVAAARSLTSSRGRAPQPSRSIRIYRNARCEPKRCAAASPFCTDAQIARRLQKARSAPDSARQDRSGRKLVARRPLVRGGGPGGHAGARCHRLRLRRGHARRAALWQGRRLQRPGIRHLARARSPAGACRHDRARSAGRQLRALRPNRSAAQCDRDTNPRDPHQRPSAAPAGIDWTRLSAEDLEEMPILAELKRMTTSNA